jgi:hypothetical protein
MIEWTSPSHDFDGPLLAPEEVVQFRAEVSEAGNTRTVRAAGRLGRNEAAELTRLCADPPKVLRLDLGDLMWADATGLETLAALEEQGAELVGTSPYITLRLQQVKQQIR